MNILIKNLGSGVKKVIINDPNTYNSLSFQTLNSLLNTFKKLDKDNSTKVIVLEGAGKGFSAGHNLKEVRELKKRSKYLKLFNLCSKVMIQIVERLIPPIIDGSLAWCQLFSEPGAGSDLAGLQTRAIKDGDEWIITGQKVWTSGGHLAEKGMLIARTDIDAPKHQGITYFAFDMDQPGVEVRPLKEMTGRALFNEVFIDEARVSNDDVIGGIGNGWAVANTTLMVERSSLGSGGPEPVAVPAGTKAGRLEKKVGEYVLNAGGNIESDGGRGLDIKWLSDLAQKVGSSGDPVVRQEIVKLHILGEVNRLNMLRAKAGGSKTGAEGNLAKLAMSELVRRSRDVGNLIIGADGMLSSSSSSFDGRVQEATIFSPAPSIYGGTDQVQRNIVGERVLGLPKEPGPNKETPFKELLQN